MVDETRQQQNGNNEKTHVGHRSSLVRSKARPARSSAASRQGAAISCSPIGRVFDGPHGKDSAGSPVRLNGAVKRVSSRALLTASNPSRTGATQGVVGVSITSNGPPCAANRDSYVR